MNNYFNLNNKNVIITGGNGFLGRVFCEAIAENNGNPILLDINSVGADNFVKKISIKHKVKAKYYKCDITSEINVKKIFKKIVYDYNKIDCLVNNAALNPKKMNKKTNLLENFSISNLKHEINVGLIGSLICVKIFGTYFAKIKSGNIVNISSDLGIIAPNQSIYNSLKQKNVKPISYSIIKSAIIGFTRYISAYWPEKNIRCNSIAPGGIYNKQDRKFVNKVSDLIPLKRMGNKNELKGALIFLLSDSSSYINGHTLVVDGGRSIW